jgi:hypothetical protein
VNRTVVPVTLCRPPDYAASRRSRVPNRLIPFGILPPCGAAHAA